MWLSGSGQCSVVWLSGGGAMTLDGVAMAIM